MLTKYLTELIFQNYVCEARNKIELLLQKLPICKAAAYVQELNLTLSAHYFVLHIARSSLIHKARQGWLLAPIQDLNKNWTSVFFHSCMVKFQELLNLNWLNALDANRLTLVIMFKIWITVFTWGITTEPCTHSIFQLFHTSEFPSLIFQSSAISFSTNQRVLLRPFIFSPWMHLYSLNHQGKKSPFSLLLWHV